MQSSNLKKRIETFTTPTFSNRIYTSAILGTPLTHTCISMSSSLKFPIIKVVRHRRIYGIGERSRTTLETRQIQQERKPIAFQGESLKSITSLFPTQSEGFLLLFPPLLLLLPFC